MKETTLDEYLAEQLKDPEFKKEYEKAKIEIEEEIKMNEMTNYIPRATYNGEDCLIIPLKQIVDVKITSWTDALPEMELTIKGVMKNDI